MPIAISTPWSTPTTTTLSAVMTAIRSSLRRNAAIRRNSPTSMSRTRGVHHDRAERRRGERREGRPEQQHRDRGRHRGDQPGSSGPAAGGVDDRGPAAGAADRHPGEEGGAEVGAAEGDQLPRRVDPVALAGGEGARGQDVVGEPHERHRQRSGDQGDDSGETEVGPSRLGQPRRDVPDHGDPVVLQAECGDGHAGPDHAEQRDRCPRPAPRREQHRGERDESDRQGGALDGVEVLEEPAELGQRALAGGDRRGRELRELGDHHDQGDAGHVAHQHRPGQQLGQPGQPEQPAREAGQGHQEGQRHRAVGGDGGAGGAERGRGHQRGRRLRPDRQPRRGADGGVHGHRADGRPQAGGRGDAGQVGVRHHLGDEVRRDGHAGDQVPADRSHRPPGGADRGRRRGHRSGPVSRWRRPRRTGAPRRRTSPPSGLRCRRRTRTRRTRPGSRPTRTDA